jgi:hypothetical protein
MTTIPLHADFVCVENQLATAKQRCTDMLTDVGRAIVWELVTGAENKYRSWSHFQFRIALVPDAQCAALVIGLDDLRAFWKLNRLKLFDG